MWEIQPTVGRKMTMKRMQFDVSLTPMILPGSMSGGDGPLAAHGENAPCLLKQSCSRQRQASHLGKSLSKLLLTSICSTAREF